MFERFDANADGRLDRQELDTLATHLLAVGTRLRLPPAQPSPSPSPVQPGPSSPAENCQHRSNGCRRCEQAEERWETGSRSGSRTISFLPRLDVMHALLERLLQRVDAMAAGLGTAVAAGSVAGGQAPAAGQSQARSDADAGQAGEALVRPGSASGSSVARARGAAPQLQAPAEQPTLPGQVPRTPGRALPPMPPALPTVIRRKGDHAPSSP